MFWLSCPTVVSQLSCSGCLAVMSNLSCAGHPVFSVCPVWPVQADFSGQPVKADMSQLSCLDNTPPAVLCWLSCLSFPVPVVLSQPCSCWHVLFFLSYLFCPGWHDLANLPGQPVQSRLTSPGCPVQAVLFLMSCPSCPVLTVMP